MFSPTGEEHDGIVCKIKNPGLDLQTFEVVVEMDLQRNERAVKIYIYTSD